MYICGSTTFTVFSFAPFVILFSHTFQANFLKKQKKTKKRIHFSIPNCRFYFCQTTSCMAFDFVLIHFKLEKKTLLFIWCWSLSCYLLYIFDQFSVIFCIQMVFACCMFVVVVIGFCFAYGKLCCILFEMCVFECWQMQKYGSKTQL